jgi:hypothetical protein
MKIKLSEKEKQLIDDFLVRLDKVIELSKRYNGRIPYHYRTGKTYGRNK